MEGDDRTIVGWREGETPGNRSDLCKGIRCSAAMNSLWSQFIRCWHRRDIAMSRFGDHRHNRPATMSRESPCRGLEIITTTDPRRCRVNNLKIATWRF